MAPDAAAPSVAISNQGNGAGSDNSGSATISDSSTTVQTNSANVENNLVAESKTGGNDVSKNMGDSTIKTGDANVSGSIINSINTNVDGVSMSEFNVVDDQVGDIILDYAAGCIWGCGGSAASLENTGNGTDSQNQANLITQTDDVLFQTNDATVGNNMVLVADSGHNDTNKNTGGDSNIETGDANVSANVVTLANNNIAGQVYYGVVNIYGDLVGDIIFPEELLSQINLGNTGNGTESDNSVSLTQIDNDAVFQTNDAVINNSLILDANTGDNEVNKNTGGNSAVQTGDSYVDAQVLNIANTNLDGQNMWLVFINQAGTWIGQIIGAPVGALFAGSDNADFTVSESGQITVTNSGNGAGSTNSGSVTEINNDTLVQTNTANIDNNIKLVANTGDNSASKNTSADSSIKTGDANIIANIVNFVNNNITGGGNLFVTVINVFGDWTGNFLSPGSQATKAASAPTPDNQEQALSEGEGLAIGGVMPSDSTPESDSNFDTGETVTTKETDTVTVLPVDQSPLKPASQRASSSSPAQIAGLTDSYAPEIVAESPAESEIVPPTANKVVRINLAWLLGLLPISGIVYLVKKFSLLVA